MSDLEARILGEAERLGFAAAGIARAAPAESTPRLRQWLADGRAAGMDYLARRVALRADPRALAPGTRSVIVVAARYPVSDRPGQGFASFARGADYHAVLRGRLRQLAAWLADAVPLRVARVCVDSAPLFEREWAVRAGVGWRGRQGQIVHPELGACLLLGALLVDLDLRPSAPCPPQCGDCRLCLDACPTRALGEDGCVDARRCRSYLTIEHKGVIPADQAAALGEALFGCDLCTAVCPWNRLGAERSMPELAGGALPDAEACVHMTPAEFEARFRHTAVFRTGLDRLRRNALIALQNRSAAPFGL